MTTTALFIVDAQNGFLDGPYGELPAPGGLAAVPAIVGLAQALRDRDAQAIIAACGDQHTLTCPEFEANGGPWPVHCVAGTVGAQLEERIAPLVTDGHFFGKGRTDDDIQYSGVKGRDDEGRDPVQRFRDAGVSRVVVVGYVTNVCVLATVLDLRAAGFEVVVYEPGCVGIDAPGLPTPQQALEQMREAGATVTDALTEAVA